MSPYIKAMMYIKDGDWTRAHDIIETKDTIIGAHIHGYLHRIEGDHWNANYWYKRAGVPTPQCTLDEEWHHIYEQLH